MIFCHLLSQITVSRNFQFTPYVFFSKCSIFYFYYGLRGLRQLLQSFQNSYFSRFESSPTKSDARQKHNQEGKNVCRFFTVSQMYRLVDVLWHASHLRPCWHFFFTLLLRCGLCARETVIFVIYLAK